MQKIHNLLNDTLEDLYKSDFVFVILENQNPSMRRLDFYLKGIIV